MKRRFYEDRGKQYNPFPRAWWQYRCFRRAIGKTVKAEIMAALAYR